MPMERYMDSSTGRVFLYDSRTGCTRWEVEGVDNNTRVPGRSGLNFDVKDVEFGGGVDGEVLGVEGLGGVDKGGVEVIVDEQEIDHQDSDDSGLGLLSPGVKESLSMPHRGMLPLHIEGPIKDSTERSSGGRGGRWELEGSVLMCAFPCMVYAHAFCCEAPIAVVEGLVRSGLYLVGGIVIGVVGWMGRGDWIGVTRRWIREGILFLFGTITLMIPCSATCCIYSSFKSESDWSLKPIPTLIGYVDPRRFYTFEQGDGAMASNQYKKGQRSMDSWDPASGILHPPQRTIDECMARAFNTPVPERVSIERMVEETNERAQRAIRKEKALADEGWLRVKR